MLYLLWMMALARPAWAVAPGLIGPLQALIQMLPQMFAALAAVVGSLLSNSYMRLMARRHARILILLGLILLLAVLALLYSARDRRAPIVATPTPQATPSHQSWVSFRGTLEGGGGGALQGQALSPNPPTRWIHTDKDNAQYLSSPVALNGYCYAGSSLFGASNSVGAIECFDLKDGALKWKALTRHPVFSSPVIGGGRLYCGEGLHEDNDCKLYCLDAQTGQTVFVVPTRGHVEAAPTLVGDRVLFSAGNEGFYCIQAESGKLIWHSQCGHSDSSAAVGAGRVYVGTAYGDDSVVCMSLADGKKIWKVKQDLPVWGHASLQGESLVVGLGNGTFGSSDPHPRGAVVALRVGDGKQLWRHDLPDSVNTSLVLMNSRVLLGCRDGFVYCLNSADGSQLWKAECGKPVLASLVVQDQTLLVAGGDGHLHALEAATGKQLWSYLISDVPCEASPMLNGASLVLGCGSFLECLGR